MTYDPLRPLRIRVLEAKGMMDKYPGTTYWKDVYEALADALRECEEEARQDA